jgi:predicted RNA binding protein YcfA (HicA-like mRNA interferase family)
MGKLRSLSGKDLLRIFSLFGFHSASQRGSHIKLRRTLPGGRRQTLTIVQHDEVDKGTLRDLRDGPSESLLHRLILPENCELVEKTDWAGGSKKKGSLESGWRRVSRPETGSSHATLQRPRPTCANPGFRSSRLLGRSLYRLLFADTDQEHRLLGVLEQVDDAVPKIFATSSSSRSRSRVKSGPRPG